MHIINLTSDAYEMYTDHAGRPEVVWRSKHVRRDLAGSGDIEPCLLGGYAAGRSGQVGLLDHPLSGEGRLPVTENGNRATTSYIVQREVSKTINLLPISSTSITLPPDLPNDHTASGYSIKIPIHLDKHKRKTSAPTVIKTKFGNVPASSPARAWTECKIIKLGPSSAREDKAVTGRSSRRGAPSKSGFGAGKASGTVLKDGKPLHSSSDDGTIGSEREGGWTKISESGTEVEKVSQISVRSEHWVGRGTGNKRAWSSRLCGRTVKDAPFRAFYRDGETGSTGSHTTPNERATLILIPRLSPRTSHPILPLKSSKSTPSPPTPTPLSNLPDSTPLSALLLPGTHQSLSRHGWPIAKCQERECSVKRQLEDGVRFLDVRLNLKGGEVVAYHSFFPQYTLFTSVLAQISAYLHVNPLETIIMCIQEEAGKLVSPLFSQAVRQDMQSYIDRGEWWLENRMPKLGDVRGKAILMSRFGGGEVGESPWALEVPYVLPEDRRVDDDASARMDGEPGTIRRRADGTLVKRVIRMGWRPNTWPDSKLEGFIWNLGPETIVDTQDWYDISGWFNIPAKFEVVRSHLAHCAREVTELEDGKLMCLSFTSASSFPFALPETIAKGFGWPRWGLGFVGVNERLRDWLLDQLEEESRYAGEGGEEGTRLRGIVPMDFYGTGGLADVMHAFNGL